MLLSSKIICIGGAANKAGIELMNEFPELGKNIALVNTTLKDIPNEYRENAIELKGNYKGCAKERGVAKDVIMNNLKDNLFDYIHDVENMAIIVTSSEGGTGSGASVMLAKYIESVYKVHVHVFIFTGFEEDARGLKNTIDLFHELSPNYTIHALSNKKFLSEAHGNRLKAEKLANKKFCQIINILLGGTIVESEQNIDESDLLKLVNTPGFMVIEHTILDKIKNKDMFNTKVIESIDNSKSLDVEPTCKRRGIILNISNKEADYVDYENEILKERFGVPYESFLHVQNVHENNYITFIIAGLKMPIEYIENAYKDFLESSNSVDKTQDDFFSKEFKTNSDGFDTLVTSTNMSENTIKNAKNEFFKNAQDKNKDNVDF